MNYIKSLLGIESFQTFGLSTQERAIREMKRRERNCLIAIVLCLIVASAINPFKG
jgi:hypothetical protein